MAVKVVHVFESDSFTAAKLGIAQYRVAPPKTRLSKGAGDELELVNETDKTATWRVPNGPLTNPPDNQPVPPKAASPRSRVNPGAQIGSRHDFEVWVDGKRAHAASDPIIIIDP